MAKRLDLVLDSRLETIFDDENRTGQTGHVYVEADSTLQQRAVKRVEWWRRERCIGSGGCGTVYLERCVSGEKNVRARAVKTIQVVSSGKGRASFYDRELEAIAKFSQEKYQYCFVKSLGWFEHQGFLTIAMEYLPFGSLQDHLSYNNTEPMGEPEAGEITYQLLEGLSFMHNNEFVHRDLKPANIMIQTGPPSSWWLKIADFGISKRVGDENGTTTVRGTPDFMAPETYGFKVEEDEPQSSESSTVPDVYSVDMWSLGVMLFFLLTRRKPFGSVAELFSFVQSSTSSNIRWPSKMATFHPNTKALLEQLLAAKPASRGTAGQTLLNPWFKHLRDELDPATCVSVKDLEQHKQGPFATMTKSSRGKTSVFSAKWTDTGDQNNDANTLVGTTTTLAKANSTAKRRSVSKTRLGDNIAKPKEQKTEAEVQITLPKDSDDKSDQVKKCPSPAKDTSVPTPQAKETRTETPTNAAKDESTPEKGHAYSTTCESSLDDAIRSAARRAINRPVTLKSAPEKSHAYSTNSDNWSLEVSSSEASDSENRPVTLKPPLAASSRQAFCRSEEYRTPGRYSPEYSTSPPVRKARGTRIARPRVSQPTRRPPSTGPNLASRGVIASSDESPSSDYESDQRGYNWSRRFENRPVVSDVPKLRVRRDEMVNPPPSYRGDQSPEEDNRTWRGLRFGDIDPDRIDLPRILFELSPHEMSIVPHSWFKKLSAQDLFLLTEDRMAQLPDHITERLLHELSFDDLKLLIHRIPPSYLAMIPPNRLKLLPLQTFCQLSDAHLRGLPDDVSDWLLSQWPAEIIHKLPGPLVAKVPVWEARRLPPETLARAPESYLLRLPEDALRRLGELPRHLQAKLPARAQAAVSALQVGSASYNPFSPSRPRVHVAPAAKTVRWVDEQTRRTGPNRCHKG